MGSVLGVVHSVQEHQRGFDRSISGCVCQCVTTMLYSLSKYIKYLTSSILLVPLEVPLPFELGAAISTPHRILATGVYIVYRVVCPNFGHPAQTSDTLSKLRTFTFHVNILIFSQKNIFQQL